MLRGYFALVGPPHEDRTRLSPTCDPTAPYLAVPKLTGFLRANGVEVFPVDATVEAFDALLRREPMAAMGDRFEDRLRRLDRRASLKHVQ